MSQDIISDALNQIMNSKKVEKNEVKIAKKSRFLVELLSMMKERGHIDFKEEGTGMVITIKSLNECKAIKPRYYVSVEQIDKYLRRFLPSRNFGTMVISTSQGIVDQDEAIKKKIGGSLIAYFY